MGAAPLLAAVALIFVASAGFASPADPAPVELSLAPPRTYLDTKVKMLSPRPQGRFVGESERLLVYPERFTRGCEDGSRRGDVGADERLEPGDVFKHRILSSEPSGVSDLVFISVTDTVQKSEWVAEKFVHNGSGRAEALEAFTETCRIKEGEVECESDSTETVSTEPAAEEESCYIVSDVRLKESEQRGRFTLAEGGATVLAFATESIDRGTLYCSKGRAMPTARGEGYAVRANIFSNDVVSNSPYYCGGTRLFSYQAIFDENNRLVSSSRTEALMAPVK